MAADKRRTGVTDAGLNKENCRTGVGRVILKSKRERNSYKKLKMKSADTHPSCEIFKQERLGCTRENEHTSLFCYLLCQEVQING